MVDRNKRTVMNNGSYAHHVDRSIGSVKCFDSEVQPCHPPQQSNGELTPSPHWRCFSGREPSAQVSQQNSTKPIWIWLGEVQSCYSMFSSWRLRYQNSSNPCDMKRSLPFVPFGDRHTQPPWSPIQSVPLLHFCNPTRSIQVQNGSKASIQIMLPWPFSILFGMFRCPSTTRTEVPPTWAQLHAHLQLGIL